MRPSAPAASCRADHVGGFGRGRPRRDAPPLCHQLSAPRDYGRRVSSSQSYIFHRISILSRIWPGGNHIIWGGTSSVYDFQFCRRSFSVGEGDLGRPGQYAGRRDSMSGTGAGVLRREKAFQAAQDSYAQDFLQGWGSAETHA